jgi:cis-3-alkyl-4-acyloxetan-2-one decarboxylase
VRLSKLAKRSNLLNPDFDVDALNIDSYVLALRANIMNQTATHDILAIKKPIHIIYGTLDPFVIGENVRRASKESKYVTVEKFLGGHEIIGGYVKRVARAIGAVIA